MFAVLHIPQFALQSVLRHEPESWARAVVLVDPAMTVPRVIDATRAAREAGVTDGQTAPQALARCREVFVRHRSASAEGRATDAILQCAYGFSPNLEATSPGTVTLDLRGLSSLRPDSGSAEAVGADRGRLRDWARRLDAELAAQQLRVRIGIGPTPNVARHAARWGAPSPGVPPEDASAVTLCLVETPTSFVAGLPVAALEPSSEVAEVLSRWGIRTVGELLALGQAELGERLGLEALGLLAAASVTAMRPLHLVSPAERFEEGHEFDPPIETLEPLLFLLRRFLESLGARLEALGLAAGCLTLRLHPETGPVLERSLRPPDPTRRVDALFRMLHTHLESVRTDSAVRRVTLAIQPARPEQKQLGLFEAALRDPHQFQETLARLVALVGADRVGSPRREDSHRPDAFTLVPPAFESPRDREGADASPPIPELLRPAPWRRLRPPLAASVTAEAAGPAGTGTTGPVPGLLARPLALRWALGHGPVREASGPWRASGHWWDERHWDREEWDVALPPGGGAWRLVRTGDHWAVEAMLD